MVIIPHIQPFETLVDTLKASNVSACHPYINFCSVTSLASSSTERCPVPPSDTLPSAQSLASETHPIIQWPCFNRLRYRNARLLFLLPMLSQCPFLPNLLGFTIQSVLGDLYKPRRSWLSNVVNRPVGILLLLNIATFLCSTRSCAWYCCAFWGRDSNKSRVCCLEIACVTISRCYFYAK